MAANSRVVEYFVSRQQACMIIPLFRQGYDTKTIAETLALPEYVIAKQLADMRDHTWRTNAQ